MTSPAKDNGRIAKTLVAHFTRRDLMLYALGIGCSSGSYDEKDNNDRELRFVYEHHPAFEAFPTFLLALSFVAEQLPDGIQSTSQLGFGIRPFPPASMANYLDDGSRCGLLPKEFFKNQGDIKEVQDLPILHISQSLILHDEIKLSEQTGQNEMIDPPTLILLETRILSVKPRNIGTFVTSETTYHQDGSCIATAQMVALILGLDPDKVEPTNDTSKSQEKSRRALSNNQQSNSSRNINKPAQSSPSRASTRGGNKTVEKYKFKGKSVIQYRIPKNAALLYRLSGDYNQIHVESDLLGSHDESGKILKTGPVLHGLCTMGYALRAVLHHVNHHNFNKNHQCENREVRLVSVKCNFVKPVFVGDALRVEVWDDGDCTNQGKTVYFRVYRDLYCVGDGEKEIDHEKQSTVVVDKGKAKFCFKSRKVVGAVSRL
mmetsp:Transcript_18453/g.39918  ORF Transcript_18453/g.39918 Transcript_18453/m.39918 type:complete len:431 (+) Transcript_18453:38-1330(+)